MILLDLIILLSSAMYLLVYSTLFGQFIFEAAATHCFEMAIHRHGCCVLQKCITSARGEYQAKLIVEVCAHAFQLAQDPFG